MRILTFPKTPFRKRGGIRSAGKFPLRKSGLALLLVIVILLAVPATGGPVLAQEPPAKHENPEMNSQASGSTSLPRSYGETLNYVLRGKPDTVRKRLEKIALANMPEGLQRTLNKIKLYEAELADLTTTLDAQLNKISNLMRRSKSDKAQKIAVMARDEIDRGKEITDYAHELAQTIGKQTGAASAPPGSTLGQVYADWMDKIEGERETFRSYKSRLNAMFHQGKLMLNLDDKAYPGLEITVRGKFDYEGAPGLQTREIEIYFDDRLITRREVTQDFSVLVKIDPDTHPGKHIVTVSAAGSGRYAPIVSSEYLEIARMKPAVDLNLPTVAFVPGSLDLTGKAYSQAGAVKNGDIQLKLGTAETTCETSEDGAFSATLNKGVGLGLIGSQSINVKVIPDEPWHAQVSSSRSLFVVNWFNSGGIIIVLVALAFVVRRRLRGFALPGRSKSKESLTPVPFPATPRPSGAMYTSGEEMPKGDPGKRIVGWYQRVVRLLVAVLGLGFGPSHTLREFLREATPRLGPIAGLFEGLTRFVERILYSSHQPTDTEARRAEDISRDVEGRVKSFGKEQSRE